MHILDDRAWLVVIVAHRGQGRRLAAMARAGKVSWEIHLDQEYEVGILSVRASPLIEGNFLILLAGAKPGGCVIALDKQTGQEVWKALDDSKSSSSPMIVVAGGKRQLIVWTDTSVTSLN